MNLRQIREECWDIARELDTPDADRLWPTSQINRYINRIYRDMARRTQVLIDSSTPAVGTISLDSSSVVYDLDKRIIHINDCYYSCAEVTKRLIYTQVVHLGIDPMLVTEEGVPTYFSLDSSSNKITLDILPDPSHTSPELKLRVSRMPLLDMVDDKDSPEFMEKHQDYILNGVLWKMYSKQDSEAFDMAKAADFQAQYDADVETMYVDNFGSRRANDKFNSQEEQEK